MLNRHIDSVIERHYATTNKALLLSGARQVGKTYAIRRYADKVLYAPIYMTMFLYHQDPQGPIVYRPALP